MSIHYSYVFGAVAAPFDDFHNDIDVDLDIDFDLAPDHDHDYMDDQSDEYGDNYESAGLDDFVSGSFPPSSSSQPNWHFGSDDSSDLGLHADDSAVEENDAAAVEQDGHPTESDEEHDQDEAEHDYIPHIAHHPHRDQPDYSSGLDGSIRESSLASTVSLPQDPPSISLASSDNDDVDDSFLPLYSQNSIESGSGSGSGVSTASLLQDPSSISLASSDDDDLEDGFLPIGSSQNSGESGSVSSFDSDLILTSGSASLQSSEPGSATASASSQDRGAPQHPRHREDQRRLSHHFDLDNNPRAGLSPRRSSLTPTIHPNRRLPRSQHPHENQSGQNHHPAYPLQDGSSDSSLDELNPQHPRRPIALSRNRRLAEVVNSSFEDGSDHRSDNPSESEQSQSAVGVSEGLRELLADLDGEGQWDAVGIGRQLEREERLDRLRVHRAARVAREREAYLQPSSASRRVSAPRRAHWSPDREEVDMDGDDELIEVVWDRQISNPPQRRPQRHQRSLRSNNNQGAVPDVIDLTEEPDSPIQHNHRPAPGRRFQHNQQYMQNANQPAPHQQHPRNPRRQMSQNGRTPSLARSDGSILGNRQAAVIDLTSDGPEDAARDNALDLDLDLDLDGFDNIPANRRLPAPVPAPQRNHRRSVEFLGGIGLGRGGFLGLGNIRGLFPGILAQIGHPHDAEVQFVGQHAHAFHMNPDPLAGNPPEFNYQANGFGGLGGRPLTPKPDFEAPAPARPGFTRNTGIDPDTNEEMLIVCASCDNELKYSAEDDDDTSRPTKRPRTKKDREEHHFWAVKACGHVSCPFPKNFQQAFLVCLTHGY